MYHIIPMKRNLMLAVWFSLLAIMAGVTAAGADPKPLTTPIPMPGIGGKPVQPKGDQGEAPLAPAGSAFTYQGQLKNGGNPANGQFDFLFTLFDAATGGNQVGSQITVTNQTVTNGLFTVPLDFGAGAFQGDARWLEIAVRASGDPSFNTLSPRQPLTPSPYAMSLMPGAVVSGTTSVAGLTVYNTGSGNGFSSTTAAGAGPNAGIRGESTGLNGNGIVGIANNGTQAWGVEGTTISGTGVVGLSQAGDGVQGWANSSVRSGVFGSNTSGDGIYGQSNTWIGVQGVSGNWYGLHGSSTNGSGVYATSTFSNGVMSVISNSNQSIAALYGQNTSASISSVGVYGEAGGYGGLFGSNTTSGTGAYGYAHTGVFAGGCCDDSSNGLLAWNYGSGYAVNAYGYNGSGTYTYGGYGPGLYAGSTYSNGITSQVYNNLSAIYGQNASTTGGNGVWGNSAGNGTGVLGTTISGTGVYGSSSAGIGAAGTSTNGWGMYAASTNNTGLQASSTNFLGVYGSSQNNIGVVGVSNGSGEGVYGKSVLGYGVHGVVTNTNAAVFGENTGSGPGIYATSAVSDGIMSVINNNRVAVYGQNSNTSSGVGVWGSGSTGVFGQGPGSGYGVYGTSDSGYGVYGVNAFGNGTGVLGLGLYGVKGTGYNDNGAGGYFSSTGNNSPGIYATSALSNGITSVVTNTNPAVYASTSSSNSSSKAIYGQATSGTAVQATSNTGDGVHAITGGSNTSGVYGQNTSSGYGVFGDGNTGRGVHGQATSGTGVYGQSNSGTGVFGVSTSGLAGSFQGQVQVSGNMTVTGNLRVNGTLSKSSGSFQIDDPVDPANKYLYHSFVESPDMKNIYDGVAVLDSKGEAWVQLPDYFDALNKDFRYQLTCIGGYAQVYIAQEVQDNRFQIAGGKPGMKVSWQVTGTRQDPYANANRIPVEQEKPASEKGTYLFPEGYGQQAGVQPVGQPQATQTPQPASALPAPDECGAPGGK